ncbi:MAG: DUF4199 domain-containing protein [Alistipes sp.]|nr:DUF4199 domain-containing protein [Alistipes sp.]MDE5730308.1 DUF4199 domain-containing protein [Alistipes sp.]MDE7069839.1 DUF4199 domain-containing protein [Alistipes sp.]
MVANFWNEACKYGAIIGAVMSAGHVAQQSAMLSGRVTMMGLMWLFLAVVYIVLLCGFLRRRRERYDAETGFPFAHGFSFVLVMILLSALIKGVVIYFYRSVAVGYDDYVEKLVATMNGAVSQGGGLPASMAGMYADMIRQIQELPEPSILATVWGSVADNLFVGTVLALILAGIFARAPRPFGPETEA